MTQISKQALLVENNQSFPNNNNGAITPSELRGFNIDMIDSTVNQTVYTTDSASWNAQIDALEAFTSSQQPSFTALNSFTASQLVINSGVNTYTQSANGRLTALETETANLEVFTSSINQILSNGTLLGLSTRFNLVGPGTFFSASIVQNVGGPIATLTFTSDNAKLNTSSFNDYTASTAATQSLFSASVATSISQSSATFTAFSSSQNSFNLSATASIVQLLNFSSSLDAGFVSEAEFAQYTQSINSYTSSTNARLSSIENITGSFATTGSNSFRGNQTITGSLILSSSANIELEVIGNAVITGSLTISGSATNDLTVDGQIFVTGSGVGVRAVIVSGSFQARSGSAAVTFMNAGNLVCSNFNGTQFQQIALENNEGTLRLTIDGSGSYIGDYDPNTSDYSNAIKFQPYSNYGAGQVQILRPLEVTGSLSVSGSSTFRGNQSITGTTRLVGDLTITGSVYGNVSASSITSQTASIDLSVANYFTLTLSGSTNINVLNPRAGVTATLVINTDTGASASFSSNVKQPSGSLYVASPSGNIDIISFTAVNTTNVFAFPAQSFV
jgi:cytoskeletal protein CcmA (bactofilin family)